MSRKMRNFVDFLSAIESMKISNFVKLTKTLAAIILVTMVALTEGCTPENSNRDVRVTTYTPQDVSNTTALCGGDVIVTLGLSLSEIGVCWSTNRNPTVNDDYLSTTVWNEPFVCTIAGLDPGTTYHVRAYALRGLEYYYGEDKSFTTEGVSGSGDHTWVDLDLPSGLLWATCNVGANAPEEYGDLFAWGETQMKYIYKWDTYKYCNGSKESLTKYCPQLNYGYNDFTDNLTVLQTGDDAATINWGSRWRMPTIEEWQELLDNTTFIPWTTLNGVRGCLFTSSNGNSIFLPAAGRWDNEGHGLAGCDCLYWSSSLNASRPFLARFFYSNNEPYFGIDADYRFYGYSVRAVLKRQN